MPASPLGNPLSLADGSDTIAAISTAVGRSALALIRLSGPSAYKIASQVVDRWNDQPGRSFLSPVRDPCSGVLLDLSVISVRKSPRSFTGEDTVELSVHGGVTVPRLVLGALVNAGARHALPGEFTRRAFLNHRLDLLQAEAVADVIDAESSAAHRTAILQLDGGLSMRIDSLRHAVIHLESLLAYDVDFPEEDNGPIGHADVDREATAILQHLDRLLVTSCSGEALRTGSIAVIAGPRNAGKSSLFNSLAGPDRAIVTEIPGTTRDALEVVVEIDGAPLRLVDTAGLGTTNDLVEGLGIERTIEWLRAANFVLACAVTADELARTSEYLRTQTQGRIVPILTKCDLVPHFSADQMGLDFPSLPHPPLRVSALTGDGLNSLTAQLRTLLDFENPGIYGNEPILTRERHVRAVAMARAEVQAFWNAWSNDDLPPSVAAVHLHTAAEVLSELCGVVTPEDVLEHLFSRFCIGK